MTEKEQDSINLLKKIRKWYYDIFLITLEYSRKENEEPLQEMLNKREEILTLINAVKQRLEEREENLQKNNIANDILKDINNITDKIESLNNEIKKKLKNEMDKISSELSSLYKKSIALTAYSKQG